MQTWLKSYLNGRTQQVKLGDSVSLSINVTSSGVPQGGHLSPILFILFINDVKDIFKSSHFLMLADDLKLYMPIYSHEDCLKLQADLDDFCLWCSLNGLNVNAEKCSQISFSRRKKNIQFQYKMNNSNLMIVTQIRDLGILLSNDLFNNHITIMCNKALRVFGFIRRNCIEFKNPNCFILLYCSLVRSILEYGSVIWNPYQTGLINTIERVQKRFLRVLA